MRTYGKRFLKKSIATQVESKVESRDAIVWDINTALRYAEVKIQGSGNLIRAFYPENWEQTPFWLKIGNAVRITHTGGNRSRIELVGHGQYVPTPLSGAASPVVNLPDAIISGLKLLAVPTAWLGFKCGRVKGILSETTRPYFYLIEENTNKFVRINAGTMLSDNVIKLTIPSGYTLTSWCIDKVSTYAYYMYSKLEGSIYQNYLVQIKLSDLTIQYKSVLPGQIKDSACAGTNYSYWITDSQIIRVHNTTDFQSALNLANLSRINIDSSDTYLYATETSLSSILYKISVSTFLVTDSGSLRKLDHTNPNCSEATTANFPYIYHLGVGSGYVEVCANYRWNMDAAYARFKTTSGVCAGGGSEFATMIEITGEEPFFIDLGYQSAQLGKKGRTIPFSETIGIYAGLSGGQTLYLFSGGSFLLYELGSSIQGLEICILESIDRIIVMYWDSSLSKNVFLTFNKSLTLLSSSTYDLDCMLKDSLGYHMKVMVTIGAVRLTNVIYTIGPMSMGEGDYVEMGAGVSINEIAAILDIDPAPPAGYFRYDIVVIGSDLAFDIIKGSDFTTVATMPDVPSGHLLIGKILLCGGMTYIRQTDIDRDFVLSPQFIMEIADDDLAWDELSTTITVSVFDQCGGPMYQTGDGWYITLSFVFGNGSISIGGQSSNSTLSAYTGASSNSLTFTYTRFHIDPGEINPSFQAQCNINGVTNYAFGNIVLRLEGYIPPVPEYFERIGAITTNASQLISAVIDIENQVVYFGDYSNKVVKIDLSTFTQVGLITLESGETNLRVALIDTINHFLYLGAGANPSKVIKIDLSTYTRVGAITLETGEEDVNCGVIDVVNQLAYFGTRTGHKIVKINLSTFTRVGAINVDFGVSGDYGWIMSATIDTINHLAYFGSNGVPGKIAKINLTSFTVTGIIIMDTAQNFLDAAMIDIVNQFAYFASAMIPIRLMKIDLDTFSKVNAMTFNTGEDMVGNQSALIDVTNQLAYFGTDTHPGRVVKVDLATFTRLGAITFNNGEDDLSCGVIDDVNMFAYFGTATLPGKVVKIKVGI